MDRQANDLFYDLSDGTSSLHIMSAVSVRSGGAVLSSIAKRGGQTHRTLSRSDLLEVLVMEARWGEIIFLSDDDNFAQAMRYISSEAFEQYWKHARKAIESRVSVMDHIAGRKLIVSTLIMEGGLGYTYRQDAPLSTEHLEIAISALPVDTLEITWWDLFLDTVVHELTHVNHHLAGAEEQATNVESEAAAEIVAGCAKIEFYENLAKESDIDSIRLTFEDQGFMHAFPGLSEGEFQPSMNELMVLDHFTIKGKVLGAAALHVFTRKGEIDFTDAEMMQSIRAYCRHVSNKIPRFEQAELH
ncbi:MAG: hypothetical protein ACNA7J_07450 [Wenzhouxiangella sp.]